MDINITLILPMLLIIEVGTVIIIVGTTLTLLMPGQLLDGSNHQVAGWYYFDNDGRARTGWQTINNC